MIKLLNARVDTDRLLWLQRWEESPYRDPMTHPAYGQLFARDADIPSCVLYEEAGGVVLFPLVLRPLSIEPWAEGAEDCWDAVTPYGYGGPVQWGLEPPMDNRFWVAFMELASQLRIISVFARLSLFASELACLSSRWVVEESAPNIVVDLRLGDDELWLSYAHKVRKNVKRAQRSGVVVEVDESTSRLDEFVRIYSSTMSRRGAGVWYRFDKSFFARLREGIPKNVLFFYAKTAAGVVSSELVLVSERRLYSFLGGTLAEAYAVRPNDLLKHAVVEWGRQHRKTEFVLGGGYQPGDGIFQYKKGFAPNGVVPFKVGKLTVDGHACSRQNELRRRWEGASGRQWEPSLSFFPAYRA